MIPPPMPIPSHCSFLYPLPFPHLDHPSSNNDSRNVDIGSLTDGLVVDTGVGNDNHTGLLERAGNVIGKVTGGETTGNGLSASERGVLEDGTVTVRAGRDDGDVVGVVNGREDTGGEDNLLPGLANVEDVDTWGLVVFFRRDHPASFQPMSARQIPSIHITLSCPPWNRPYHDNRPDIMPHPYTTSLDQLTISTALVHIRLHGLVAVLGTEVALSSEEELDVVLGSLEGSGKLVGGHFLVFGCIGWGW